MKELQEWISDFLKIIKIQKLLFPPLVVIFIYLRMQYPWEFLKLNKNKHLKKNNKN